MAVDMLAEIPGVNIDDLRLKGFKVHEVSASVNTRDLPVSPGRRDFYKMGLVSGDMTLVADGLFVTGVHDISLVKEISASITLPVNVVDVPKLGSIEDLTKSGVKRISMAVLLYKATKALPELTTVTLAGQQKLLGYLNYLSKPKIKIMSLLH